MSAGYAPKVWRVLLYHSALGADRPVVLVQSAVADVEKASDFGGSPCEWRLVTSRGRHVVSALPDGVLDLPVQHGRFEALKRVGMFCRFHGCSVGTNC